ncbi:MAG: glycosyltransferase [Bacteroidales bacterium]|nr:glycosyltransferase [Bacteroidales bacterium]
MEILILNCNTPLRASGIVALDLFNEFKKKGHNVRLMVNKYDSSYPEDIISMETWLLAKKNDLKERIYRRLKLRKSRPTDINYHYQEVREQKSFYSVRKILRRSGIRPDVIFVLFAKNFINSKDMYEFNKLTHAKIFWLMYDMAPLTGGCHYAWDCKGYQNSCGNCPGIYSNDPLDISHKNILYKKKYIDNTDIHLIAASEWQFRQAKTSTLFKNKPIEKVLLSVDPNIFKPVDKKELRLKMGIDPDKKVIFFGAVYLHIQRKGMSYLLESFNILKERLAGTELGSKILLLIAGREIEGLDELLPLDAQYLGFLDNTYGIASAFQVADLFICPSIEDSGPQMINMSIMCGTPVVSFEMGVSPDLVISGQTGYMAKLKDSVDLAQRLYNVLSLNNIEYQKLSDNCRELGLKLCSPDVQIENLEKIIEKSRLN